MAEGSKKRKSDGDSLPWTKANAATFVKNIEEIQTALSSCDKSKFVDNLVESLDHASPHVVDVLKELVSPFLLTRREDSQHCVACHQTYKEVDNHDSACVIHCVGPFREFRLEARRNEPLVVPFCCGVVYEGAADQGPNVVCCEGRHTTNPDEVGYYDSDLHESVRITDEDVGKVWRNRNSSVRPCDYMGCGSRRKTRLIGQMKSEGSGD